MGKWYITPSPLRVYGLNDLAQSFKGAQLVSALVRESLQNCLDARNPEAECVTVKFGYTEIDPFELPLSIKLKGFMSKCECFPERSQAERKFFQKAQSLLDAGRRLGVFSISDYGTTGLTGVKTNQEGSRWNRLVMTTGAGNDNAQHGGGFGLGKETYFLASRLRTVFFSTLSKEDDFAGHMGVAWLATFKYLDLQGKENNADRTVFYVDDNYNPTVKTSSPTIAGAYKMSNRKNGEYGTDVFIPGFEEERDPEELSLKILRYTLLSFMVAIADGRLKVVLPNGREISKTTLKDSIEYMRINMTTAAERSDRELISELYTLTQQSWCDSEKYTRELGVEDFSKGAFGIKFMRSSSGRNSCFVTREKGMVVHEIKPLAASTDAVGLCVIKDEKLSSDFKRMENASHTKFEVAANYADNTERSAAKLLKSDFEKAIRQWAEKAVGEAESDVVDAVLPDELDAFIEACSNGFSVENVKAHRGEGINTLRARKPKKHKPKPRIMTTATTAGEGGGGESNPGIKHNNDKKGGRESANHVGSKGKLLDSTSLAESGFVLTHLERPIFFANGQAKSGVYKFSFRVPRDKALVCANFSATTESDGNELIKVKSVVATCNGQPIKAEPILKDTAAGFYGVKSGDLIESIVTLDVDHYVYSAIRYYEKKGAL